MTAVIFTCGVQQNGVSVLFTSGKSWVVCGCVCDIYLGASRMGCDIYLKGGRSGVCGGIWWNSACVYLPGRQQGGASAQRADEMDGQVSSVVVGESEASLDMLQRANVLWPPPAGIHTLTEHQLVPYVPTGCSGEGFDVCCLDTERLQNKASNPHTSSGRSEKAVNLSRLSEMAEGSPLMKGTKAHLLKHFA